MAYVKRDNDRTAGFSYLDGIPVKISEKYRAPRKITLPLSYQQRCPVELLTEEYDFSLERRVLEEAEANRKAKEAAERERTESVGTAIEEFTRLLCLEPSEPSPKNCPEPNNWPWVEDDSSPSRQPNSPISKPPQKANGGENDILKPTKPSSRVVSDKPDVTMTSALNLEDFESESSPFDSVALRSLDDMEELKRVLQGDDHQRAGAVTRQRREEEVSPYAPPYVNGAANVPLPYPVYPNIPTWQGPAADCPNAVLGGVGAPYPTTAAAPLTISTPDLLKELGAERDRRRTPATGDPNQAQQWAGKSRLVDGHSDMGPEAMAVVKHITDMGFPRSRVTRAVHKLGADDKKVVEHLCSVQSLVEKGYKADQAEAALHLHDQNESRAQQFLELVAQFRDLGFDEETVKEALLRTNNDRDRALDFLVS